MGCSNSKDKSKAESPNRVGPAKSTHPLVTTKINAFQKIKAIDAVKKDDPFLVQKLFMEMAPTENLGPQGSNFTCLHHAANNNSFMAMGEMISILKKTSEKYLKHYMDIEDADGITPVVYCLIKDSFETFLVLYENDAINPGYLDEKGQGLLALARKYDSRCLDLISKLLFGSQPKQAEEQDDKSSIGVIKDMIRKNKALADEREKYRNAADGDENALLGVPSDSKVYQLITNLQNTGRNFQDTDFPSKVTSITNNRSHKSFKDFADSIWKRPHEFFECDYKDIHLFDNIDPNDIAQGLLGVCYLLSSLSALAEYPSRLAPIYLNTKSNKYGVYGLKFYLRGIPTEIVVDDYFPCFEDKNLPLFARPKGKELWVLLAEKAWAKIFKTYIACEVGFMDEALECLTGAPSHRYMTQTIEVNKMWEIISNADKNKFIITGGTHGAVSEEMGLVPNHGYSIISVHEFQQCRLLKLRNPWGKFEWTGDYSDNSKLWTNEMKEKIGYSNEDDGVFCMTIEDFKKNFSFFSIGMYHDGWEYSYLEASSKHKHGEYFKFTIDKPCEAYFRIHQEDKRNKPESEKYEYSSGDIIVCKVEADGTLSNAFDQQGGVHQGIYFGARSIYPNHDCKLKLTPGEYIIRTKMRWRNEEGGDFTVSSYAPFKIELERIPPVKDYVKRMLQNVGQKLQKKQYPDHPEGCVLYGGFYSHYVFTYLENKGTTTWDFRAIFDKLENLRLGEYKRIGDNAVRVSVEPGTVEIIIAKKIDVAAPAAFNIKMLKSL